MRQVDFRRGGKVPYSLNVEKKFGGRLVTVGRILLDRLIDHAFQFSGHAVNQNSRFVIQYRGDHFSRGAARKWFVAGEHLEHDHAEAPDIASGIGRC